MKRADIHILTDYIILFCQNMGVSISPLKVQKLLYYVQAWHIAKFERSKLMDSMPEAWVNGPVFRSVYDRFKQFFFRNANIRTDKDEGTLAKDLKKIQIKLDLSEKQQKLVDTVLESYAKLSDERLVLMTHSEDPWNEARQGLSAIERSKKELSVDTIYRFFNKRRTQE